jgi:hypothetical protein
MTPIVWRKLIFVCVILELAAFGQTITVDSAPRHVVNSFSPVYALGTTVDRVPSNATDTFFRPDQLQQILSAGWGMVSYRHNPELFVQAWHWNPKGKWSDPAGNGYFVGDSTPVEITRHSYGYSLPHRGFTRNGGTEFDGFSRLDDGDTNTYWKSNPYLAREFSGDDDILHPQWVVIDLGEKKPVNAIRIAWGEPFAKEYSIQYWTGEDAMDDQAHGDWKSFEHSSSRNASGGTDTLTLRNVPVSTRFVRLLMTKSSQTCDTHGTADRRNCVGYAIREIYLGAKEAGADFKDVMTHSPDQKQTLTYCSSVDPWHEPSDLYVAPDRMESGDQPGLDLFYTSGITRGLPAMIPVGLLYNTPEDAAAQITYLKKRGYPIAYIEMGEEADGQYMVPEDYGALYLQFAASLHQVDPTLKLGGPAFEGVTEDIKVWADSTGRNSWFGRFLDYLKAHNRMNDFSFMSFEHYPYDGCDTPWENLYQEPELLTHIMQVWRDDGMPAGIPLFDTETNAHGGEAAVDIFGALWIADTFGGFLTAGGKGTYYYHALPYSPAHPICPNSWGTYHMFMLDEKYQIRQRASQFYAAQLITQEWVEPKDAQHQLFKATSDIKDEQGHILVTAYAVKRPDGQWALMVINKDRERPHGVRISFHDAAANTDSTFSGQVTMLSFGSTQYQWHPARKKGYADPDDPPTKSSAAGGRDAVYTLPSASLNVLRGNVETLPSR